MKKVTPFSVKFYAEPNTGRIPARNWLRSLTKREKSIIGHDLLVVQFSWPIGMPIVRNMKKGLWELRSKLIKKEARVFFTIQGKNIILLHGFVKKTQKTPKKELDLAIKRLKTYKEYGKE